jgi:hypothetical protein
MRNQYKKVRDIPYFFIFLVDIFEKSIFLAMYYLVFVKKVAKTGCFGPNLGF